MSTQYKVWVQIEKITEDEAEDVGLPDALTVKDTLEAAQAFVRGLPGWSATGASSDHRPLKQPVTVTFNPRAWVNDYATDVDPEGPTTFQVEAHELEDILPNSAASDALKNHDNAPQWIRDWSGPFYFDWCEAELERALV